MPDDPDSMAGGGNHVETMTIDIRVKAWLLLIGYGVQAWEHGQMPAPEQLRVLDKLRSE